jgi:hypothetical protein
MQINEVIMFLLFERGGILLIALILAVLLYRLRKITKKPKKSWQEQVWERRLDEMKPPPPELPDPSESRTEQDS